MKDPIMEILEEIVRGAERPEEKEEPVIPNKTKDFNSYVSDEEYEAIVKVKDALESYIEVHIKCVTKNVKRLIAEDNPYAEVQYLLLQEVVKDAMKYIGMMYTIHTVDKEFIDSMARDTHTDVKGLIMKLTLQQMTDRLGF